MSRDWTIDSCVLYKAAEADEDANFLLLNILHKRHYISLDIEGLIEKEYRVCLERIQYQKKERDFKYKGSTLVKKWFRGIASKRTKKNFSSKLHKRHKKELEKLNFHKNDYPFIAVCAQTENKNLVTEDGIYKKAVKDYLQEKMGVHVLSIQDSINLYKY